jgi:hypothetical protein
LIAQQKCSMGQGARQLGRERQTRTGAHRVRLERRKRAKMLAYVPFQRLFERCVMCFCDAASSTHSEKEAPLDHLVSPLYLFHFMFFSSVFSLSEIMGREIQRVSELVTVPTRQCALDHATSTNLGAIQDLIFLHGLFRMRENFLVPCIFPMKLN